MAVRTTKGLSWYVAGNLFREDGWRQFSPSEVRQAFAKLGWQHGKTSINLSVCLCGQLADWQRPTGHALSRAELFQRVQHSRRHLESVAVSEPEPAA